MGSNLSVPRYIQILQDSRRSSWPLLAQKIQTSEWIELSQLLVQAPFDAVRQVGTWQHSLLHWLDRRRTQLYQLVCSSQWQGFTLSFTAAVACALVLQALLQCDGIKATTAAHKACCQTIVRPPATVLCCAPLFHRRAFTSRGPCCSVTTLRQQ